MGFGHAMSTSHHAHQPLSLSAASSILLAFLVPALLAVGCALLNLVVSGLEGPGDPSAAARQALRNYDPEKAQGLPPAAAANTWQGVPQHNNKNNNNKNNSNYNNNYNSNNNNNNATSAGGEQLPALLLRRKGALGVEQGYSKSFKSEQHPSSRSPGWSS
ncbi:unnamed protein product [Polarella glacialis]|uniref:Uncharacterized protein n=1 Tax=Polarella glacialis TaxID=89957 RepID=A0A813FUM1_POLGL|nr:unnamed protein product [Polarella glacialis]